MKVFYGYKKTYEENIVLHNYNRFKNQFEECLGKRLELSYKRIRDRLQPHLSSLDNYKPELAKEIRAGLITRFYPYVDLNQDEIRKQFDFSKEDLQIIHDRNKIIFYEKYLDPPF